MTTEVTNPLTTIGGAADIDSPEVQELFNKAYAQEHPEHPKVPDPIDVPAVVEQKIEATPATPEIPDPAVVENKAKTEVQPDAAKEVIPAAVNPPAATNDPNAWINSLPNEDLKAQARKIIEERDFAKHQWDSDRQRAQALNRKAMNQDRELAELRAKIQRPQAAQDPQLAAQATKEANKSLAEWEELVSADPKLAKAIEQKANEIAEARHNAAIGTMDEIAQQRVKQAVAPLQQSQLNNQIEQERQLLLKSVPNAQDVFASEQYAYWLENKASPGLKNLAYNSTDHRDALEVLSAYSYNLPSVVNEMVALGRMQPPPAQPQAVQQQQAAATPVEAVDTSKADKVAKTRADKLTNAPVVQQAPAAVIPTSTVGAGGIVDLDDEGVQAYFTESFKKNLRTR